MAEITDPAMELAAMCEWFARIPANPSNHNTGQILVAQFGKGHGIHVPYVILGVVQKRFERFGLFINSLNDEYLDSTIVKNAQRAIKELRKFCDISVMGTTWSTQASRAGNREHLNAIKALSYAARRAYPINKLSPSEIDGIKAQINEETFEHIENGDLPDYIKYSLIAGLSDLLEELTFLPVYGFDHIGHTASTLFALHIAAEAASESYRGSELGRRIGRIILSAVTVWIFADAALTATSNHIKRADYIYNQLLDLKALPAPDSPNDASP